MLNISKQIYYGWNSTTSKDPLPEVEIIPGGSSTNEKKRLEKVTSKYTDIRETENIPLPGFTLFKSNRKNYGSADPTWLIIDPRGFLARITNENLEEILYVTGITEGLIQEKCVWAREDSQTKLTLIPVSSPDYIDAVKNTALLNDKVVLKDVQIGDKVLLQNELVGTYMGVASLYGTLTSREKGLRATVNARRQIVMVEPKKYFYQTDLKILKVLEKAEKPLSREESVELMNDEIKTGKALFKSHPEFTHGYYSCRDIIKHVSTSTVASVPLTLNEITLDEAEELFKKANKISDSGLLAIEDQHGVLRIVDFPYSIGSKSIKSTDFTTDRVKFNTDEPDHLEEIRDNFNFYNRPKKETFSLDKFTKFYKIVKHVKNESYV